MWILRPLSIYSSLSPRKVVYKIGQSLKSWMAVQRGKFHHRIGHESPEGIRLQLYSFFYLGARWGVGGQRHAPRLFTPAQKNLVPIV